MLIIFIWFVCCYSFVIRFSFVIYLIYHPLPPSKPRHFFHFVVCVIAIYIWVYTWSHPFIHPLHAHRPCVCVPSSETHPCVWAPCSLHPLHRNDCNSGCGLVLVVGAGVPESKVWEEPTSTWCHLLSNKAHTGNVCLTKWLIIQWC